MIQKQKLFTASLLVLLVCFIRDIERKDIESPSSSSLRRGNLAEEEHNVSLMQKLHLPFGQEEHIIPERNRKDLKDIKPTVDLEQERNFMAEWEASYDVGGGASPSSDFGF